MNRDTYFSKLHNKQLNRAASLQQMNKKHLSFVYKFSDIEHVIQLSHRLPQPFFETKLFEYDAVYYVQVTYPEPRHSGSPDWCECVILEYGEKTQVTIHALQEYGHELMGDHALYCLRQYFQA